MVDLVDSFIGFFCQRDTASQCSQFIYQYPEISEQIVWLVLFPTVFLLMFIYLLTDGIIKHIGSDEKKKFQLLVAVSIYLFIVFQGWYHYVLGIAKYWFIVVILLSGFFIFISKMGGVNAASGGGGGGGGGGGHGHRPLVAPMKAFTDYGSKRVKAKVTGQEKALVNAIEESLRNIEDTKRDVDRSRRLKDGKAVADLLSVLNEEKARCREMISQLESMRGLEIFEGYSPVTKDAHIDKFRKRLRSL